MTVKFFAPSPDVIKPYALMDLDDTLFQTQRKIDAWQLPCAQSADLVCAAVNKQGEPLSYMSARQAALFNWLRATTELIVVTARDAQEIQRVKLAFSSWQVLTHGALILREDGKRLISWQQHMAKQLRPLQDKLTQIRDVFDSYNAQRHSQLHFTAHTDYFGDNDNDQSVMMLVYLAIKHAQKNHDALVQLAYKLPTLIRGFEQDFYVHVNANNLAILPHVVHKQHAVRFLLDEHLDPSRPSFGFGDSLADLPFLQHLDWYGMPSHGQLHDHMGTIPRSPLN